MKTFVLLCSVFLAVLVSCLSSNGFRGDYQFYKAIDGYIKYQEIPANWREARLRCHLEGSKLASPLNQALREAMTKFSNSSVCGVFTGLHSTFSRGDFFSVEGIPLAKIPHTWTEGEPDNVQDQEGCIVMLGDGTFADINCSETFPYLCYKKATLSLTMTECGTWDPSYTLDKTTGHCYKFHQFPRTWSRAYMTCAAEGGYLAVLNSEAEAKALGNLFNTLGKALPYSGIFFGTTAHIGFQDWSEHGGEWVTIHGDNLKDAGFDTFQLGEPNNISIQFCGGINKFGNLDDMWCETRAQFICEKDPDFLSYHEN